MTTLVRLGGLLTWLACALPAAGQSAQSQREVIWYRMNFPPLYIPDGPLKDKELQRVSDAAILKALEDSGYRVVLRSGNLDRILHAIRNQEPVCAGALLQRPELAQTVEFSIPHSLTLGGGAVLLQSRLPAFKPFLNKDGRLSLEDALRRSSLRLGLASGRGYSGVIDEILLRNAQSPNLFSRKGADVGLGLMRMLASGRIDYALLFPWEAGYLATVLELEPQQPIVNVPIRGMTPYELAGAACPKNAWGRRVISIMNQAIRRVRDTPENQALQEYWLDEGSRELYRSYLKAYREKEGRGD